MVKDCSSDGTLISEIAYNEYFLLSVVYVVGMDWGKVEVKVELRNCCTKENVVSIMKSLC